MGMRSIFDALPPRGFVASAMKFAVVDPVQRNRELIRYFLVGGDEADAILTAIAARLRQHEGALFDNFRIKLSSPDCRERRRCLPF
jgi:hypothetical protein